MSPLLAGKAGLVTGAASGIGRACAIRFAQEGAAVIVADLERAREGGEETGFATDACLVILDHFPKETAPSSSTSNTPGPLPKIKPEGVHREE